MPKLLLVLAMLLAGTITVAAENPAHDELRALLNGVAGAINQGHYDQLAPYFHRDMLVTTINQEVLSSPKEIAPYFEKWFGPGGYLKKLEMTLTPDAATEFYADDSIGVVRGGGDENYFLADQRYFAMKTRWTATVIRDTDGKWRILALHIGTDFLDNPILEKAENSLLTAAAITGVAGLLLGLVLAFLLGRRRR